MHGGRSRVPISLAIAATLAIAACAPAGSTTAPTGTPTAVPSPQRGAGGTLRIRWVQPVGILNSHMGQAVGRDYDAARLVIEPLARIGTDGQLVPVLAADIPTVENGGVAKDLTGVTWRLRRDVRWSDGTELTSADVVFTWTFMSDKATGAATFGFTSIVKSVEAVDKLTVRATFLRPLSPVASVLYFLFVGSGWPILQEKQFKDFVGARAKDAPGNQRPVGTGPYKVKEFKKNDIVTFEINEHYREASKPYFREVVIKGGGEPITLARAVFETGDADYMDLVGTENLTLDGETLKRMSGSSNSKGVLVTTPTAHVERVLLNRADPDPALAEKRSEPDRPHPFLSDLRVRQALAMAVDRRPIAELFGGEPTCNVVVGNPAYTSPNTANDPVCKFDLVAANRLLDEAGWIRGADGIRRKGGVRMRLVFATSVNPTRQRTQELLKEGWSKIGVETELTTVVQGAFFGGDAPDRAAKFFTDAQMFASGPDSPDLGSYLRNWTSAEIKTKADNWSGGNYERWSNKEYDDLFAQARAEGQRDKRHELIVKMNDLVVRDVVLIPLVVRTAVAGVATSLKGHVPNFWDSPTWDIADWRR